MKEIAGVGACSGVAIGKLRIFHRPLLVVQPREIENIEKELLRFHQAHQSAIENIGELCKEALKKVGPEESMIFSIHQLMLEDQAYIARVESIIITERFSAEYAVEQAGKQLARMFREMDSPYMKERSADVVDVSGQIIRVLSGQPAPDFCEGKERFVLAASNLLPSEVIQMDRSKVLALITSEGSRISHAAILSRSMGIPTVVNTGISLSQLWDGQMVIVDGTNGIVIPDPDRTLLWKYQQKKPAHNRYRVLKNAGSSSLSILFPTMAVSDE